MNRSFLTNLGLLVMIAGAALITRLWAQDPPPGPQAKPANVKAPDYQLSGPYTHDNLTIFLIHGPDQLKGKKFLTLQEALEQKKVVVHETGNVNQLTVENLSPTEEIFIQSGDIVKGGQQDRLLSIDLIVPPKSGKVPIASFCVEHGRWTRRGSEAAGYFAGSYDCFAGNDLKLATKFKNSQPEVWKEVANAQAKIGGNAKANVKSPQSESSLQLTLEHKKVQEAVDAYLKKLTKAPEDKKDAIGYAMAINGKVICADVYASRDLFLKLWPKLLKSCAVEAFAELNKNKKFGPVKEEAVKTFLTDSEKGKATNQDVNKRVRLITVESRNTVLFETRDKENPQAALHRNYLQH
jgi:hypothetical protein